MPVSDMETRHEARGIVCSAGLGEEEDTGSDEYWPGGSLGQYDCWILDADSTCRPVRPGSRAGV